MNTVKKLFLLLLVLVPVFSLWAQSEGSGVKSGTSLSLAVSSLPEGKLTLSQSFTVPALQGDGPLVKGNNVKFGINAEVTPISMNLLGNAVFTPIAFIELAAGGMIGSGWNIEGLGKGIGINVADSNGKTSVQAGSDSPFGGTFLGAYFGGAFQFDFAAIAPGDWNHVLIRTYHEASTRMFSSAKPGDAWIYESDHGENQNGWKYYGSYLLGYQMPIFLNTVALMAEMNKYLYNTPGGEKWGDSVGRWDFGLVMNFKVTDRFGAALITQFRLYRNYSNFEYGDKDNNVYYRERDYDGKRDLKFYRVAAILSYKLN
jgi:hypothetical protein